MYRYGTRGQGISTGQLRARETTRKRREDYAQSPERIAFRHQVREHVLRGRVNADPASGEVTPAQVAAAREELRAMGAEVNKGSLA
ncbi:hypothetical protein [Flaviflexus sp.]|uniref:hypothetical protein n=1 Tax=Flaviflexus sp. TaxID=1969482 RepID=UPI003F91E6B3